MKLLTVAILSQNRFDLLSATINSLLNTITYPHFEIVIYNHEGSIGEGWNHLLDSIRGEYVLMCQDDWFFIERWNWVERAIDQIKSDPEAGIVRLRKDEDGQENEVTSGVDQLHLVDCVGGGFTMNPFICKKDLLDRIGKVENTEKKKGVAELELRDRYKALHFNTYKLNNAARGVCIHIGRGRRILGRET